MSPLDRFGAWLDTHEHIERRVAVLFLVGVAIYVGGHVAIHVF